MRRRRQCRRSISIVLVLLGIVWATGCASGAEQSGDPIITTDELKSRIDAKDNFVIVDVRTAFERKRGFIPGSIAIPLDDLRDKAAVLPKDKDIVVYCYSGSRGTQATNYLLKNGFTRVKNYVGSWREWTSKKLPIQKDE